MGKVLKRVGLVLLCVLLLLVLIIGGYVAFVAANYSRIPDGEALTVENPQAATLGRGQDYTALTYNIGFGAYDHAFSFFMDTGRMLDGTPVTGTESRAASLEVVQANTQGVIGLAAGFAPDFQLYQEADVASHRSWKVDQSAEIRAAFPGYGSVFAHNFQSVFLMYPPTKPIGAVESGLLSLSRFAVEGAQRRSYPVDDGFPTKFFDLDRCFSVLRLPVEGGGELVLMNSHMSAFDEGGIIRAAQLKMLAEVMAEEQAKGNWVVVGGDFNHMLTDTPFPSGQEVPGWVFPFDFDALPEGFSVVVADNAAEVPTCRSTDMPYTPGVNFTAVLDGFIVSDNVRARAENVDNNFRYSDHNPVLLTFALE